MRVKKQDTRGVDPKPNTLYGHLGAQVVPDSMSYERNASFIAMRQKHIDLEKKYLIDLLSILLVILPIDALAVIRTPLYALIIMLEALFLLVDGGRRGRRKVGPLLALDFAALPIWLITCWLINGGNAFERLMQTALYLLTFTVYYKFDWYPRRLLGYQRLLSLWMAICFVWWLLSGKVTNYYSAFYLHSNGFAVVVVSVITILMIRLREEMGVERLLSLSICFALLIVSNSRSALIALILTVVLSVGFQLLNRHGYSSSMISRIIFITMLVAAVGFTVVYPSLLLTPLGMRLELLSREYFHKNFFSGRQVVWTAVLEALKGHEVLGLGLAMTPSMVFETVFSSHNLYLQTILQSGIIGLVLVVFLLWGVLDCLQRFCTWESALGSAFIIGILAHETMEVALTQNNIAVGLMFWVVLAIASSVSDLTAAKTKRESSYD